MKKIVLILCLGAVLALLMIVLWPRITGSSEQGFLDTLKDLTEKRINKGFHGRQAHVLEVQDTSLVLISNIQGQISSLNRIIKNLQHKEILTAELKIKQPKTLIVFNGNCIGNADNDFEILKVLVTLLLNNDGVFYIRGVQEDKEYWFNHELGAKIKERFGASTEYVRITLRNFFSSLPIALYLYAGNQVARISQSDDDDFKRIACQISPENSPIKALCSLGELCSFEEGKMSAKILADLTHISWEIMKGLQAQGKPPVWYIVSTPSASLKQKELYTYEAFALLKVGANLENATITLNHRKENGTENFTDGGSFAFTTGDILQSSS